MKSKDFRSNPLFLRNEFEGAGKWEIPIIRKQSIDLDNVELIAINDAKYDDRSPNTKKGVHFFVDDYRFNVAYFKPENMLRKVSQYKFVCTPDFSTYSDMQYWRQLESVAHSRWCGAFWQSQGVKVIPTITWSTSKSYDFCFDGIEKGAIVAIGMIGCKTTKAEFMSGYDEMLVRIEPEAIICFGDPYLEMAGRVIKVDYIASRKVVR